MQNLLISLIQPGHLDLPAIRPFPRAPMGFLTILAYLYVAFFKQKLRWTPGRSRTSSPRRRASVSSCRLGSGSSGSESERGASSA